MSDIVQQVLHINEEDILACDPFEGDSGDCGDRTLRDKIVTARKPGECHLCGGQIIPGTRTRSRVDIFDGVIMYFRWCNECCIAMAKSWEDDGDAYEKRAALRR